MRRLLFVMLAAHLSLAVTDITISVNETVIDSGDWVRVSFAGVPVADRASECWIGVFSPANVNVTGVPPVSPSPDVGTPPWTETAPVKFIYCYDTPAKDFLTTGSGYYDFTLLNIRGDYTFWIFTGDITKPVPVAQSAAVGFRSNPPTQVHLALTQDPTIMSVVWNSISGAQQAVQWGMSADQLLQVANATAASYVADDLCGPPGNSQGWRAPGFFHTAFIPGLTPGSEFHVFYSVGCDEAGWSPVFSFLPAPLVGPHVAVEVIIIADVGVSEADHAHYHWEEPDAYQTMQNAAAAAQAGATALFHIGDLSYATGYAAKWDIFMCAIEPVAAIVPYMVGQGNHERDVPGTGNDIGEDDSGGECGLPAETRFLMPTPSRKQDSAWYSVDHGNVHFLMMDTEMDCAPGSTQYTFLETDLKAVSRTRTPWVVFMGHRPMYWGNTRDPFFAVLEPLLYENKVDLALWGHVHFAQATCPVLNGTCQVPAHKGDYDAPVHAIVGNGGMQPLSVWPPKEAPWTTYHSREFGYSILRTDGSTSLWLDMYANANNTIAYTIFINRTLHF